MSKAQRDAFETIAGGPISDLAWLQAGLPLRLWGCGVGAIEDLAPVGRLAAILQFARGWALFWTNMGRDWRTIC